MKQTFTLLAALLLITACSKESAEPEKANPELQGRWTESSHSVKRYDAAGNVLAQEQPPLDGYYMRITADSLIYRRLTDNRLLGGDRYVRQDTLLRLANTLASPAIAQLTDRALTLRFRYAAFSTPGNYIIQEDRYTR